MRNLIATLMVAFAASTVYCQEIVALQESQTFNLYRQANESLNVGDTKNAIQIFDKLIEYYQQAGLQNQLPESYLAMALSFALNGNHQESIRYHKKALRAHHKYKGNESAIEIELNLGLAYQLAGKERKAKKYLKSEYHG